MSDFVPPAKLNLEDLLTQIVERAQEVIPFDSGGIAIYDANSKLLAPRTYLPSTQDAPMPRLIQLGEGVVGHVAEAQQATLINDVTADTRYIAYDPQTRSELAVPMLLNGELLGVFNAESYRPGAYKPQHTKILQGLADQAALAISTARLYQALSQRYKRLTDYNQELFLRNEISRLATSDFPLDVLLPQMAERLAKLVGADACALTLWDAAEQRGKRLAAFGLDATAYLSAQQRPRGMLSLTGEVVHQAQPVIVNDAQDAQDIEQAQISFVAEFKPRALLAMPLIARGRPIGAAILMNLSDDEPYTQAHADKVAASLDQLALALDNNLLLQDMQARLSETSVLLEIAAIAASSLELDEMLQQVLKLSQQLLGVTCGVFLSYDRATNTLGPRRAAWFGFDHDLSEVRFPVADPGSRIAIVFTSGSPYYANELSGQPGNQEFASLAPDLRSVLIAPLRVQDEPLGVFLVANKQNGFTRSEAHLLMAMGSHVAAALRNADLLADTRDRLRETEALQRIVAITSSTLDLDEILEHAVQEAAELLDVEGAVLMMPDDVLSALVPHERSRYGIARTLPFQMLPLDVPDHIVHVYNSGQAYVSNDPPSDPIMKQRNIITYPLSTHNRVLGTISLINRRSGEFEDTHIELTRAIASQMATSMENAQLFATERTRADLMSLINRIGQELTATLDQQGLMRKVVNAIHDSLGYETVSILLLDESGLNVAVQAFASSMAGFEVPEGYTFPITKGVVGRAMRTGETQLVPDVQRDPDFFIPDGLPPMSGRDIVVPLRAGTRILGCIDAIAPDHNAFQETDHVAMETLASQVSIVIENARLWNQAQRRLLEQDIVHQIGQDLTSILDYNELVNAVVQHMTRALDTSLCLLILYDAETGRLTVDAEYRTASMTQHTLPPFIGQPLGAVERAIILRAIQSRRQNVLYRDGQDGEASHQAWFAEQDIYAQLTLPMIAGDRIVGSMVWLETRAPREFTGSDVRLAQTLTTQAAIAIENARLFRQAQRQAREQTLLRGVAVGLSAVPDMESLLRQLAYETSQALEVDNVILALRDQAGQFPVRAHYLLTRLPSGTALGQAQSRAGLPALFQSIGQGVTVQFNPESPADDPVWHELAALTSSHPASLLWVPIMRRGEIIGLIEAASDSSSRVFDRHEVQLLEAIANQAAIAIDNVSLYEREQRHLRQLERLQVSSRNIAGLLQTSILLDSIVHEAAAIFDVPAVSLMMRQPGSDTYVHRASVGLSARYMRERRLPVPDADDVRVHPQYIDEGSLLRDAQAELIQAEGLRGILSVPIVKAGQHLGILKLYSKDALRRFTDEERDLAQLFASQAATALENANLFETLEERADELVKANRLKSELLARVSHELRTPMNSINGYSEMLLKMVYGDLNEKQADRIERIWRNGRNLLAIIDDLLDISKIDAGHMELQIVPVNLLDELNATIYALESQVAARGLYLRLEAPDGLPPVKADAVRLKQILTNLLGNAIKFTRQGGVIVRVQAMDDQGTPTIWTSVIDTGIGIKAEDQQIIFDEFRQVDGSSTREFGGTGLGLAITKKLVEMMAGRIWVESEVGKGSTFTFALPVAAGAPD
jgi:GAF domain-containing protein/anti-sigma regulatory factor (Ser/Thr protein kinase)